MPAPTFRSTFAALATLLAGLPTSFPAQAQTGAIQLGGGNASSYNFPLLSCYTYNYSQQLYTADEITAASGLAGDITAIRFFHLAGADDAGTGWNNWTVYMGATAQAEFTGTSGWVPYSSLEQVFSGTVQPVAGSWMEIVLDAPFHWDGVQNLVVAIDENSPGFGCTAAWKAYDAGVARALLFRSDPVDPDPATPPPASIAPSSLIAQVQFVGAVAACLPPAGITAHNITPTTLDLTWTGNTADSYDYEVRTSGAPGSGSAGLFAIGNVVTGTPAVPVTGLPPNTVFFCYVRGVCGGLSSQWSWPLQFRTPCEPDAVPFSEDFDGSVPPAIPACFTAEQAVGEGWNTTAFPLPGMNGNCAHAAYDLTTLPDAWLFTTGLALQGGTSYRLSYLYGTGNTETQDNISIHLSSGPTRTDTITTLAQHIGIAGTALANSVDFTPDASGVYYIGFRYFALPGGNPGQVYLDDIHVGPAPTCEAVPHINAMATATDAGTISWDAPAMPPAEGYDLYFSTGATAPDAGTTPSFTAIPGTSQPLMGLTEGVPVQSWVRSRCSASDQSAWTGPASFTPGIYQIGSGPGSGGSYPINSCYNFNYSQQIYLAAEYHGGPLITHVRFKYGGGSSDPGSWSSWTLFMGHTGQDAFSGPADWLPYGQLQQVFTGTVAPAAGEWMDITLDAPFSWDGSSNIVVAVNEHAPGMSCTATWATFDSGSARGLLFQNDAIDPDPAAPPAANQGPDATIAQVQFIAGEAEACNTLPTPGATTGPDSICPGIAFTLGVEEPGSGSGISYQWQTSTDGIAWNNAPGNSTNPNYSTAQASATWYRAEVTCAAMGTAASTPLLVGINPFPTCYCQDLDFTAQVEPICNVTFAGIDNGSPGEVGGSPALEDFTAEAAAEVVAGAEYPISVTGNTNGNFTDQVSVFFDWDQDGQFEAAVPLGAITNSTCDVAASGTITVPGTALPGSTRMRVVKNAGSAPGDPCGLYSYGQAEDYLVNVTVPVPCDALPEPGNTIGPASVCADVPFTLTLQNTSAQAGISYQWQISADGTSWSAAPGNSTQASYTTSQATPAWYRAEVACDATGTSASTPLSVAINAPTDCYCTSLAYTYQVQPICHVAFAGIDNGSNGTPGSSPALEDFTAATSGNVTTGFTYPLTVSGYSDLTTSQVAAFFDWDRDGVFETSVPLGSITNAACTTPLTAMVTVPASALAGTTRMRVLLGDFQVPADPCGTYSSGQGEDYLLNVSTAIACDAAPTPGNTTGPASICPSTPFTLGIDNVQPETGISYQWQHSADGISWNNAPGNSNGATFSTSLTAPTWYRAEVTCAAGGVAFSTAHLVSLAPPADCYCSGAGFTAAVQPICNVSFADLDHASDGTLNGSPGHENFSAFTAHLFQGHTYPLTVNGNTGGGTGYVSAFFDWDGNGVFETAVNVGIITGMDCSGAATVPITVPVAATPGTFHARIVMNANNYATDPCAQYTIGQAEDYSIEVNDAIGITEVGGAASIKVFPNPAQAELFLEHTDGRRMDVKVYDMLGHLVMQQEAAHRLNIGTLAPGSYLLLVHTGNSGDIFRARFIKQ